MNLESASTPSSALQDQIRSAANASGLSPESIGWLIKALHPACANVSAGGFPDRSFYNTARPDYRARKTFSAPPGTTVSYDAIVWSIPGDVETTMVWTAPAGTDFTTADPATVGVCTWMSIQTISSYASPGISNIVSYFPPVLPSSLIAVSSARPTSDPVIWRHRYSSYTVEVTAPTTGSQGTIVSSQFPLDLSQPVFCTTVAGPPISTWPAIATGFSYSLVDFLNPLTLNMAMFDENILTRLDPRVYAGKAIDGVYVPLRLTGPDQNFVSPTNATGVGVAFLTPAGVTVPAIFTGPIRVMDFISTSGNQRGLNRFLQTVGNSGYDKVNTSVTVMRGLDASASFTVKLYVGLEIVVDPASPFAPVVERPSLYDPAAIDLYYRMTHTMNNAYPSVYNSLGILASVISKALPHVLPIIEPLAGKAIDYAKEKVNKFFGVNGPDGSRALMRVHRPAAIMEPGDSGVPNPDATSTALVRAARRTSRTRSRAPSASSRRSSIASSKKKTIKRRVRLV